MPGDPSYSLRLALYTWAPGVVASNDIDAALGAQYAANGYTPLTQAQVLAIVGTPLPVLPLLPRFQDSNPDPRDGWRIERSEAFR